MYEFDLFVIGAGSGGVRAARMAAANGAKVAIAEDLYLGGTCVNVGCIPKKLYATAAHYHYDFQDSAGFGWDLPEPVFNWNRLRDNKQQEIHRLNGIYERLLTGAGVELIKGRAVLDSAHTLDVGGKQYSAAHILIATGGWPQVPVFPGSELAVTSNEIFDLASFPKRVLVVGGGYIAVELAGIFAGLGAQTTLSYRGDMPLKGFDADVRSRYFIEAAKHINMAMNTQVTAITAMADGERLVKLQDGRELKVDCVLFATGRVPNTSGLGLEKPGVMLNPSGTIAVDEQYRSSVPSIYAIGDVVGKMTLTPVALAEGMLVANHLFGDASYQLSYANIPTTVFCHPNVATVGLSEDEAVARHGAVQIFESDFRQLKHTLSNRDERTYMKLIVESATDRVLGMHMMGADAGEIIQGFTVAMNCGLTKAQLDTTIGIHPTVAEEFVTMRKATRETTGKS